jgi:hypothetical protein
MRIKTESRLTGGDRFTVSSAKYSLLGVALIALGLVVIPSATATVYTRGGASPGILELLVYSCFSILLIGTILTFTGILNLIDSFPKSQEEQSTSSWFAELRFITNDRSSRTLRLVSGVTYGVLLSILSGILVFQPAQSFSTSYHVAIPSIAFAVCCGPVGQMPQLVVYLSNNVGIVMTPLGLLLLFSVSWLVAINVNAAWLAYRARIVRGNGTLLTTTGSFLGILSLCPSCAQGVLVATLGGSGIVFVTLLSSYQGYLIALSIPLLVISLVWTAKSFSKTSTINCELPNPTLP